MKKEINEQDLHTAAVMVGPLLAALAEERLPDGSRVRSITPQALAEHVVRAYQAIQKARELMA